MTKSLGVVDRAIRWTSLALGPYFRDLSPLRDANDPQELKRRFPDLEAASFGFNGDLLRAAIVRAAFEAAQCTVFLETGTYRAATSLLAARLLRCPVYTSELNAKNWLLAVARCAPIPRIHPRRLDSREFLRAMIRKLSPHAVPFIYLDAHWYDDLPLQEEVDLVFSHWRQFVLLIDDFQVPGKPHFGFDTYAGEPISLSTVRFPLERLERPSGVYFPAYEPEEEVGGRRGYVLVAGGLQDRFDAADRFPLNLLQAHPVAPSNDRISSGR